MSRVAAAASTFPSPTTLRELIMSSGAELAGNEFAGGDDVEAQPPVRRVSFVLTFTNLTYTVEARARWKDVIRRQKNRSGSTVILDDISGEARDGEILAVMGASGSGKSTLIDALAAAAAGSSIRLNGERLESRLKKAISAYVMQDDLLFPMLTVEETLRFAAELRLPRSLAAGKKKLRVEALIDQLGLRKAARTLIGDEGHRGVSGGERRRVSIGADIIHDPILLFLDEPTSGLDSTSAFMVVKVLQRIAMTGSIIVMSIHQPSHRIIKLLDRMIFLSRGKVVYGGTPANLPAFFADFGRPIPDGENWADFALDLIKELEDYPEGTKTLIQLNKSWQPLKGDFEVQPQLSLTEAIAATIIRGKLFSDAAAIAGAVAAASMVPKFANPFWIELSVLSKRSFTNFRRNPKLLTFRLAAITATGIILATVFHKLDKSPKGIRERLGFFAFAMSATFYTCADALPIFLQERYIFMRETAYNAYRRSSYVLAISFVFLPLLIILAAVFAVVTFWSLGLGGSFFFYFLIILASYWAGNSFVTFLSGVVPEVILGYIIVVTLLGCSLLFSGFFINGDRIPKFWIGLHYISLIKYPYEAVLKNEFQDSGECFVRGVQIFDGTPLAAAPEALKIEVLGRMGISGLNITAVTCVSDGEEILRRQAVSGLSKWGCLWVTVGWGFFFRILFYVWLAAGKRR
ncbi:ABC transporter G family member 6-like [Andrographis paniculata]|uniref:ABC transporter G family member 6-like n=1 Tax=Andrographis paniculata TaxID=175694 RepID=UPI0021E6DB95|nr:ABC transporter G family member 6-like [Andrographis paniculata]